MLLGVQQAPLSFENGHNGGRMVDFVRPLGNVVGAHVLAVV